MGNKENTSNSNAQKSGDFSIQVNGDGNTVDYIYIFYNCNFSSDEYPHQIKRLCEEHVDPVDPAKTKLFVESIKATLDQPVPFWGAPSDMSVGSEREQEEKLNMPSSAPEQEKKNDSSSALEQKSEKPQKLPAVSEQEQREQISAGVQTQYDIFKGQVETRSQGQDQQAENIFQQLDVPIKDLFKNCGEKQYEKNQTVGESLRSTTLYASTQAVAKDKQAEYLKQVKLVSRNYRKTHDVFLSAITRNEDGSESIDYKAAKLLVTLLRARGVSVFWWEDPEPTEKKSRQFEQWRTIGTKIAMGLAFSSIFLGLSFATAPPDPNNKLLHTYQWLKGNKSESPYQNFYYEVDTFNKLIQNKNGYAEKFIEGVVSTKALPEERSMLLFAYGNQNAVREEIGANTEKAYYGRVDDPAADDPEEIHVYSIVEKVLKDFYATVFNEESGKFQKDVYRKCRRRWKHSKDPSFEHWFTDLGSIRTTAPTEGVFHTSEITPSDYYFEYAVVDKDGYDATAEALKDPKTKEQKRGIEFFLEMDYDSGKPYYRICMVVKDWNNACIKNEKLNNFARQLNSPTAIEEEQYENLLPEPEQLVDYPLAQYPALSVRMGEAPDTNLNLISPKIHNMCTYAKNGGKLYISASKAQEGMFGQIAFGFYDGKGGVTEEKVFRFAINFSPKDVIRYKVKKHGKKGIRIRLLDKLPATETRPMVSLYDLRTQQTAIKSGLLLAAKVDIDREYSRDSIYRLRIDKGSGNRLYILRNVKGFKTDDRDRMFKNGQLLTCPFCAGILRDPKQHRKPFRKGYLCCDGTEKNALDINFTPFPRRIYCNIAERWLPKGYERSKGLSLAFAGYMDAGKSSMISASFAVKLTQNARNIDVENLPLTTKENDIVAFGIDDGPGGSLLANALAPLGVIGRYPEIDASGVYVQYARELYREFVRKTSDNTIAKEIGGLLRKTPIMMTLTPTGSKGKCYFSCFDAPGAAFQQQGSQGGHTGVDLSDTAAAFSSALILVMEPEKLADVNDITSNLIESRITAIERLCEQSGEVPNEEQLEMLCKIDLAIVLNKCDSVLDEHDGRSNVFFDEGGYVRSTPPGFNDHYHGSPEENYVDQCSEEVKAYLKNKKPDLNVETAWGESFEINGKTYQFTVQCKYFAVSSIGHPRAVSIIKSGSREKKITDFLIRPKGLEHVFMWLAYQGGLIR